MKNIVVMLLGLGAISVTSASAIPFKHGISDTFEARPIQEDYGTMWGNHITSKYSWE